MPSAKQVEVTARDPTRLRCAANVARVARERSFDVTALEFGHHVLPGERKRELEIDDVIDDVELALSRVAQRIEFGQAAQRERSSNGVVELAYVSRPVIGLEPVEQLVWDGAIPAAQLVPESLSQQADVAVATAERWKLDARYGEAEKQVVSKASGTDLPT